MNGQYLKEIEMIDTGPEEYGFIPEGDLMTVKEYLECVEDGAFIDDDGFGHPVKDDKKDSEINIHPSDGNIHIPDDATHILWYNR